MTLPTGPHAAQAESTESTESTRTAFKAALVKLLQDRSDVVCVDTDTGLFTAEDRALLGDRCVHVGIAEHTAVAVAASLARSGIRPVVTAFAAFAASRAAEAVKLDVAYAALPVTIAASHAGLSGGFLGPSHHCLEDLAVMRALPGMTVLVPGDAPQAAALTEQATQQDGPVYLRLGRKPSPVLTGVGPAAIGAPQLLLGGEHVVLFATGPEMLRSALHAADYLQQCAVHVQVVNVHTVKPLDPDALLALVPPACALVVTLEEHWAGGGLGDAVSQVLAAGRPLPVLRLAVPDRFVGEPGTHQQLLLAVGLDPPAVAARTLDALNGLASSAARPTDRAAAGTTGASTAAPTAGPSSPAVSSIPAR